LKYFSITKDTKVSEVGRSLLRPYKIDILFAPFALSAVDSPGLNRAGQQTRPAATFFAIYAFFAANSSLGLRLCRARPFVVIFLPSSHAAGAMNRAPTSGSLVCELCVLCG